MGRGKKERANRGASGGANYAWVAAALVGVLAVGFFLSGFWGTRGCTDVSALNYAPAATADDGTCVGSMYDLSGVFEFQTTAAAAPKQLEAIGIEFEADMQMQMVIINKVSPGSVAASSGVRAGDELLAMKDASSVVLVSSRGYSGAINAVQAVMGAWPGTPLRWVLRHAAALGGIEDIHLTYEAATIEVMPSVMDWQAQQQHAAQAWSDERERILAFAARDDLQWCRAAAPNLRHYSINGWIVLSVLTDFEDRLTRVVVGRDPAGEGFDVSTAIALSPERSYNSTVVRTVRAPSKLACCSYSMASSYDTISVGDEVLVVDDVQVARQGPDAMTYALWRAAALPGSTASDREQPARSTFLVLKQKVPAGKRGDTMQSKVERALGMVDPTKPKLDVAEARRAMALMKRATRHVGRSVVPVWLANHTGSVTVTEWATFANSLYHWAIAAEPDDETSNDKSKGKGKGESDGEGGSDNGVPRGRGGFRPELLELAVQAMAKNLQLTLLMTRALTVDGALQGFWDKRDQYEELMAGEASGLRLSSQFAKLMQSLLWLNRTASACALGELAVSEAVYSRVDQASAHFTRGIATSATGVVARDAVASYADLLEAHAAEIQAEYRRARELSRDNPWASSFFKPAVEEGAGPMPERPGDVEEFELFRRGYELKHCATIFPLTCELMRRLPEASKFAGSVRFSTIAPGASLRPHFALTNDHLRLHLGIDVPEPDVVEVRNADTRQAWEEGKVIAFDESIIHSINHRGGRKNQSQTVLIIDVVHPNHPDASEVLRDTTTEEEVDGIEERQQDWHAHVSTR